jgi:hypothetical protein
LQEFRVLLVQSVPLVKPDVPDGFKMHQAEAGRKLVAGARPSTILTAGQRLKDGFVSDHILGSGVMVFQSGNLCLEVYSLPPLVNLFTPLGAYITLKPDAKQDGLADA